MRVRFRACYGLVLLAGLCRHAAFRRNPRPTECNPRQGPGVDVEREAGPSLWPIGLHSEDARRQAAGRPRSSANGSVRAERLFHSPEALCGPRREVLQDPVLLRSVQHHLRAARALLLLRPRNQAAGSPGSEPQIVAQRLQSNAAAFPFSFRRQPNAANSQGDARYAGAPTPWNSSSAMGLKAWRSAGDAKSSGWTICARISRLSTIRGPGRLKKCDASVA